MAGIRRQTVPSKSPEVLDISGEGEDMASSAASGPVAVPNVEDGGETGSVAKTGRGRGRGRTGPHLSWGYVVEGKTLNRWLIDIAREVSKAKNGYATLTDLLTAVQEHPVFADNSPNGVPLANLVTATNLRNEWALRRDRLVIQYSGKPESEGGLGLEIPVLDSTRETEKAWVNRLKNLLTASQWAQMEDQIAKSKSEGGKEFPKLVILRGRRSTGIDMDEI